MSDPIEMMLGAISGMEAEGVEVAADNPNPDFINRLIRKMKDSGKSAKNISDTHHTFGELYHHRAILFMTICHVPELRPLAWKSKLHDDPNEPMFDGMFICGIETPEGQATYHYDIDPYWDMFQCQELERAPKWDGHTPDEAIRRIASISRIFVHP